MMAKWGHVEGQGLGSSGDGIVSPLMIQQQKQKAKPVFVGGQKQTGPAGGIGSSAGKTAKIVNNNESAGREERERWGEPSSVVVLCNMVGLDDVEDEELVSEIGMRFLSEMVRSLELH